MSDELRAGAVRVRPGAEAGQAAGRRAGPGAGPAGHQGRRRRRGADGQPARAAVRPPAAGAGRAHRPRPGAARPGRRPACTARSTRCRQAAGSAADEANRLHGAGHRLAPTKDAFADADFVIEAVFEELDGQAAGAAPRWRRVVRPRVRAGDQHLLAVGDRDGGRAGSTRERVVGFHFFNPVAVLPLLEVVRGRRDRRRDAGHGVRRRPGAEEVRACWSTTRPAFVVNRLLTRFLGEVAAAVDEGTPFEVADRALAPLGLPMSPFVLLQLVGPAVALHVSRDAARGLPRPVRGLARTCGRWSRPASPGVLDWGADGPSSTRRWRRCCRGRRPAVDRRAGARPGAGRRWPRSPADAGRGRRRRAAGRRPVHAARRRLAVPARRDHAVPGPHGISDRVTGKPFRAT